MSATMKAGTYDRAIGVFRVDRGELTTEDFKQKVDGALMESCLSKWQTEIDESVWRIHIDYKVVLSRKPSVS